jgi:hypothetical protein
MTRRFEKSQLSSVPAAWNIGPPHYVGIGCFKAGTSWWHKLLLEHPSIRNNRLGLKELFYFCHFGYHELDAEAIETYRQAFAAPQNCFSGEWSVLYLTYPFAINHLAKVAPEAKLLAIVRNPIDRLRSALNHVLSNRLPAMDLKDERAYVFRNFSLFPEVMSHMLVSDPFRRLLQLYDRSKLLVLQYEKCRLDTPGEISKTYRFLGLDDSYMPPSLNSKINVQPYIIPPLSKNERVNLTEYFYEDVHSLAKLFPNIDLSLWPEFS